MGVPPTTAQRIADSNDPRRLHNNPARPETRGRKSKLTGRDLRRLERLLITGDWEARILSWESLAVEADLDVSRRTIQRAMHQLNFRQYLTCKKAWIAPEVAQQRVAWAQKMLEERPTPEHWKPVRFSDETHLGFGAHGRTWVIRRPGEANCNFCVDRVTKPKEKDEKRVHCWGVVGYDYKSPLHYYDNGSSNGKMDRKTYRQLLEKECIDWPAGIWLEEDGDSGHGWTGALKKWKDSQPWSYYKNCPYSPDLAPIENAWRAPKQALKKYGHWDDESIKEVAEQGWDALKRETINEWVLSMPDRLQKVIDAEGQLTTF